jgi:dimethylargininase
MVIKAMPCFTQAIVRTPSINFAEGLTSSRLGTADYQQALQQHAAYCNSLVVAGISLLELPPDDQYPDSTFVEDTAIVTARGAIITRPGANSRVGETDSIREVLEGSFPRFHSIDYPGTVDGGDVCEAGNHFFIGISRRTNEPGAKQLAAILAELDYSSSLIDIRDLSNILHLKSGLAFLGNRRLGVIEALAQRDEFQDYDLVAVPPDEEYAANCLHINNRILIAAGFPKFEKRLCDLGYETIALEMSEFQKMDGGLSCLSIRF